jgi:LmbE family N-acetylglucosaminyl deacetylase
MTMNKVLVIAAHPDDEILGCGGTLLKHICMGDEVYVAILGEGITSRTNISDLKNKREVKAIDLIAQKVSRFMGWKKIFTFKVADNRFDSIDLLDITKMIEEVKKEVDPHTVYTHHFGDLNMDHRITHEAVLTAFRPLEGGACHRILTFETPSSTEWSTSAAYRSFIPTVYVDITDTIEQKCKAMELYESEVRSYPHPRSIQALKINAQHWGIHVGMAYAEVFSLVRELS